VGLVAADVIADDLRAGARFAVGRLFLAALALDFFAAGII
jgi:hypothetical protein